MNISNDIINEINMYLNLEEKYNFNTVIFKKYSLKNERKKIFKLICANKLKYFLNKNEYIYSYKYYKYYVKYNALSFDDYFNMLRSLSNDLINCLDLYKNNIYYPKILVKKYVWSKNINSPKRLRHGDFYIHSVYRLSILHMQTMNLYDRLQIRALIY